MRSAANELKYREMRNEGSEKRLRRRKHADVTSLARHQHVYIRDLRAERVHLLQVFSPSDAWMMEDLILESLLSDQQDRLNMFSIKDQYQSVKDAIMLWMFV